MGHACRFEGKPCCSEYASGTSCSKCVATCSFCPVNSEKPCVKHTLRLDNGERKCYLCDKNGVNKRIPSATAPKRQRTPPKAIQGQATAKPHWMRDSGKLAEMFKLLKQRKKDPAKRKGLPRPSRTGANEQ